ncbi:MAG TPA: ester cyclase [Anaerolineales bacterium]|nr:ester cyclase [Anaerolineales bacterium]
MSQLESNKAFVRKVIETCWVSAETLELLTDYVTEDYIHHTPAGDTNLDGFKRGASFLFNAFPDMRYTFLHLIAEGDMVAAYLKYSGTHLGQFGPFAPTGKIIPGLGTYYCRIADGKIAEDWDIWSTQPIYDQTLARLQS